MTEYVLYINTTPIDDSSNFLDREDLVKMLSPRRVSKMVDKDLRYWGYTYYSEVLAVIKRSGGISSSMGKTLKKHMKQDIVNEPAPVFTDTTDRFKRINSAVSRMPSVTAKLFIHRHYVINEERKDHRNEMQTSKFAKQIGVKVDTYNNQLSRAKQSLIELGVLIEGNKQ